MRILLLFTAVLMLFLPELKSQSYFGEGSAEPPPELSAPEILLKKDLMHYLLGTTWTWVWNQGRKTTTITFNEDQTARTPYWTATFKVLDPKTIQLNLDDRIALLTFDPDYLSYKGKDFNRKSTVLGKRQK